MSDIFDEMHGKIFTDEEEKQIQIQGHEEYLRFLEDQNRGLKNAETENENDNGNGGDVLGDNYSYVVNSISQNKKPKKVSIENQDEKTKATSTLLGRKTGNLSGTGNHGANAKDNQRDKKVRSLVAYVKDIANGESIKCNAGKFDNPNIKNQFGSSFVQNMSFLNTKFYKIICYQKDFKNHENDNIIHRNKGLKNKNIIMKMLEKEKNELFVSLMKAKLYNYEEIAELIKKHLPLDENDIELNAFKDAAKSLINELESNKSRTNVFKPVDYITIEELED